MVLTAVGESALPLNSITLSLEVYFTWLSEPGGHRLPKAFKARRIEGSLIIPNAEALWWPDTAFLSQDLIDISTNIEILWGRKLNWGWRGFWQSFRFGHT
jgi:hypothetical protein